MNVSSDSSYNAKGFVTLPRFFFGKIRGVFSNYLEWACKSKSKDSMAKKMWDIDDTGFIDMSTE